MASKRIGASIIATRAALACVVGGCNSPTLPVPPPVERPDALEQPAVVELLSDGKMVRIAGDGALRTDDVEVLMLNEETGLGARADKDSFGHYEKVIGVELGCIHPSNHVELWQRRLEISGANESPIIVVTVPRSASELFDASACADSGRAGAIEAGPENPPAADDGGGD
jgi:hypothetical protein